MSDEVYKLIAKQLVKGKVVPVLGAGVNLCGRPANAPWQQGRFLPSGAELAAVLAEGFPTIRSYELAQVAQYVAALAGRGPLYEQLHEVFDDDYPTTCIHRFLARLSRLIRTNTRECMLLVTTNYDDSLERAFADEGEPYELVSYVAEGDDRGRFRHFRSDGSITVIDKPNKYRDLRLRDVPIIVKLHGAVDRINRSSDSFVITEDHYIEYLTRADVGGLFPVNLGEKLHTSHFLFLGYSLRDWNLRVMLYRIRGEQRGLYYNSWAVQPNPDRIDKQAWEQRNVDIIPSRCEDFVAAIEAELVALDVLPSAEAS
jgi:hypothetical protein